MNALALLGTMALWTLALLILWGEPHADDAADLGAALVAVVLVLLGAAVLSAGI